MGKLEVDSSINHFSHEHPLELINSQAQTTCSGCKGNISGWIYACRSCNYCLHKACSNLPRTLNHQADEKHNLVLLSSPAYPEGAFKCNACGSSGTGFSYHCPECQLDLHTVCAFMPLSIDHTTHKHTLTLCYKAPYRTNAFKCDICEGPGSNHWLYHCGLCEFDAHMKCAKAKTASQALLVKSSSVPSPSMTQHFSPLPQVVQQHTQVPYIQTYHSFPRTGDSGTYAPRYHVDQSFAAPLNVQTQRQESLMSNLAGHAVEGIMGGIAQELAQMVLQ